MNNNGDPVLDSNGRFIPLDLRTVFVMRKEVRFGADYQDLRNGEWEYVSYNPDGSFATAIRKFHLGGMPQERVAALPVAADARHMNAENDIVF